MQTKILSHTNTHAIFAHLLHKSLTSWQSSLHIKKCLCFSLWRFCVLSEWKSAVFGEFGMKSICYGTSKFFVEFQIPMSQISKKSFNNRLWVSLCKSLMWRQQNTAKTFFKFLLNAMHIIYRKCLSFNCNRLRLSAMWKFKLKINQQTNCWNAANYVNENFYTHTCYTLHMNDYTVIITRTVTFYMIFERKTSIHRSDICIATGRIYQEHVDWFWLAFSYFIPKLFANHFIASMHNAINLFFDIENLWRIFICSNFFWEVKSAPNAREWW